MKVMIPTKQSIGGVISFARKYPGKKKAFWLAVNRATGKTNCRVTDGGPPSPDLALSGEYAFHLVMTATHDLDWSNTSHRWLVDKLTQAVLGRVLQLNQWRRMFGEGHSGL